MRVPVTLFLIFCFNLGFGQDLSKVNKKDSIRDIKLTKFSTKWENKNRMMHAWLVNRHGFKQYGLLYEVTDSTIKIALPKNLRQTPVKTYSPNIPDVQSLLLREDKRKGKFILMGIPIGAAIGVGIASIATTNYSSGWGQPQRFELIIASGVGGGLLGFVSGMVIGSKKLTIPINGDREKFEKSQKRLKKLGMMNSDK